MQILALLPDPVAVRRLRCALQLRHARGPAWQLTEVDDWPALHRAARATPPALATADPHATGTLDTAAFVTFRTAFPSVPLLPYGDFQGRVRDAVLLTAAGLDELVVRDQDDAPTPFARIIEAATADCFSEAVLKKLEGIVPSRLVALVRHLLTTPEYPAPGCVAKLYFRHCNTLREHLREAGLPPVNKLIVWTRLFRAAHLLADPQRTIEGVALALSFSSPSGFRNQLQRYTGMTPQQVRACGVAGMVECFRHRHRADAWDVALFPAGVGAHEAQESNPFMPERVCLRPRTA